MSSAQQKTMQNFWFSDYAPLKKWACLDTVTGEDLAEAVRKYHLPDFL
jgi:hypothetical protein